VPRPEAAPLESGRRSAASRLDAAQRAADTLLIVLSTPLWLPVLVAALLSTHVAGCRPLLFRQTRMGRHCRPFTILKIRTMRDGPAPAGALFAGWTYANDPRVTPAGAFLRRYRLDELPQFWNVLRGDMSLVGPRPEPIDIARRLGAELAGYHARHAVRPGLTGLCQISSVYRDFGTIEKSALKLQFDLEYVRTRSLRLYGRILLQTLQVLRHGEGMA